MWVDEDDEVKGHLGVKRSNYMRPYWSVASLFVCDKNVKVFVELALISLFLHQFRSNLEQMILGWYRMWVDEDDEVKGHLGFKRSNYRSYSYWNWGAPESQKGTRGRRGRSLQYPAPKQKQPHQPLHPSGARNDGFRIGIGPETGLLDVG